MAKASITTKETIEYDTKALKRWGDFCDGKGYVKRQASHACRIAFMAMSALEREKVMAAAMADIHKANS